MKVLQILKTSDGATWAYDQALKLSKNGVDIVTILPDKSGKVAKKYINSGMRIIVGDYSLPIKKPYSFWKKKRELIKIVNSEKPDIIHFHFVTNVLFGRLALMKNKTPRLFQVPGPLHLENRIIRKIEIGLANEHDYWAPACVFSKKIYEKYVDNRHVFLAYYGGYGGVSIKKYTKTNKLHKEYDIPNTNLVIAMVSYFYKPKHYIGQTRGIKGHEDFIDAISILNKKYNNITAVVVGGPWGKSQKYEEKVKKYAEGKKVKNIIFTGFRDDVKEIYKEFDVVVHPSHSENLGGAAESLAAAVPTVSTMVGGFPDIVIDGVTGFLCLPNNPASLSAAIEKMLNNRKKAIGMAKTGQNRVKELLDIETTSMNVKRIYDKIVSDRIK